MSYAELLQEWRAGVLPVRNSAGRKREALKAPSGGNLPILPVLPVTKHEGEARPEQPAVLALVRCGQCRHFEPDTVNPAAGLGGCGAGVASERPCYPNAPRRCATWNPTPAALLDICRAACDGLAVEPKALAGWLEDQGDSGWMTPPAVRWWAELIQEKGWPA